MYAFTLEGDFILFEMDLSKKALKFISKTHIDEALIN